MTDDRSLERSLERAARSWLESELPTQAPDRAVEAALSRIQTTPQERGPWIPWRLPNMNPALRAAVLGLAVVALGGALLIFRGGDNIGPPSLTPTSSPTTTPVPPTMLPIEFTGACSLVASEDAGRLGGIIGQGTLMAELGSGNETTCVYSDGGGTVLRITWTKSGGEAAFAAVRGTPGVEAVADLGDEAFYDPAAYELHVRKGDAAVAIRPSQAGATPAELRLDAEAIWGLVADRL